MSSEEQPQGRPSPALRNFPMATSKRWCPEHHLLSDFWLFSECHCQQNVCSYYFLEGLLCAGHIKAWRDIEPWSPGEGRDLSLASVEIVSLSWLPPTLPSSHHPDLGLTHQAALSLPERLALTFPQLCFLSLAVTEMSPALCTLLAILNKALSINTILF